MEVSSLVVGRSSLVVSRKSRRPTKTVAPRASTCDDIWRDRRDMDVSNPPAQRTVTIAVPEDVGSDELTVPHALAHRLRTVVEQGYDVILLDVSRLTHCNSMTLGAIVQTYVTAVKGGAVMKLLHVRRRFRDLLAVTKIDKVIEIMDIDETPVEEPDTEGTAINRAPINPD